MKNQIARTITTSACQILKLYMKWPLSFIQDLTLDIIL